MAVPKVVVVVAARLNSERFPRKVLATIGQTTMLNEVLWQASFIECRVVLSRPLSEQNMQLFGEDDSRPFQSFGPEDDLIRRHLLASEGYDHVVRVTGDCPFLDPWAARCTIDTHLRGRYDLTVDNTEGRGVQVYTRALLEIMDRIVRDPYEREHLDVWPLAPESNEAVSVHRMKFSVDTPVELDLARRRITL